MVLAIDIGNTNIVIGVYNGNDMKFIERVNTNKSSTVLEYVVLFKTVLDIYKIEPDRIEGSVISSVVPSVTNTVNEAVRKLTGKESMIVGSGIKTGLNILIDNPAQLGSDLVVGAVAGAAKYPLPLAIIDMGTATTISVVDSQKCYIGGLIMPGVRVSLDSLINRTSQLPNISLNQPGRVIGKNTVDCMKSGMIYGSAANIDGVLDRIEDELGQKLTVIATGGLAQVIIPYCKREITLDNELLLDGLMIIYNKNK